ncbi:hypothetical protein YC2023_111829 [Brassica napus]
MMKIMKQSKAHQRSGIYLDWYNANVHRKYTETAPNLKLNLLKVNQYKRVAKQKKVYDQEVIQLLQWMLMKLDDREDSRITP